MLRQHSCSWLASLLGHVVLIHVKEDHANQDANPELTVFNHHNIPLHAPGQEAENDHLKEDKSKHVKDSRRPSSLSRLRSLSL